MDGLEMERLPMQFRSRSRGIALKFPGENRREVFVVAQRFAFWRLMFFAKMCAARFVAGKRIYAHELGELEKIGDPTGAFESLVKIGFVARHAYFAPESFSQLRNSLERLLQAFCATRHPAFVPEKRSQLAMN